MELIIVHLTTASHRAAPNSGKSNPFVRLSFGDKPQPVSYLYKGQWTKSTPVRPSFSLPVFSLEYDPDRLVETLVSLCSNHGMVTCFLVNDRRLDGLTKHQAYFALTDSNLTSLLVQEFGLKVEKIQVERL